jgi:ribonuclease P protein component
VVVARRRPEGGPSRLGMSVRTGAGSAVERNRIRRRVRAAFVAAAPPGYDVVVRADASVAQTSYQELVSNMKDALTRAVEG